MVHSAARPQSMFTSASNVNINGGIFTNHTTYKVDGFQLLLHAASPAAFHNSHHRSAPRETFPAKLASIHKDIEEWIQSNLNRKTWVLWLQGDNGIGKSEIAQSIANVCEKKDLLMASFFFNQNDDTCNDTTRFIPTIAYQLVINVPESKPLILEAIERNPLVLQQSLETQLDALILEPLRRLNLQCNLTGAPQPPRIIIVDALDQCYDEYTQMRVISTISRTLHESRLPVLFLVTSRVEQHLVLAFQSPEIFNLATMVQFPNGVDVYSHLALIGTCFFLAHV